MTDFEEVLGCKSRLLVTNHHMAHAASCFYPSPYEEAAILTVDGVGEWATCSLGHGRGNRIELLQEIHYPHSLGLLYSGFTYYCGFKVNSGEYKLMGLAAYGQPKYADTIREHLIDILEDGSFRLDTSYFGYLDRQLMTNSRFDELFGGPAQTRLADHPSGNGSRVLGAACHGRSHAQVSRASHEADRVKEPGDGWRGCAQLRSEWAHLARDGTRRAVCPAGGRRRRRRAGAALQVSHELLGARARPARLATR